MALDSQKVTDRGTKSTITFSHNSTTSKFYSKLAVGLFFVLQMLAAYLFNSFYAEFSELEAEVDTLHYQVERLQVQMNLVMGMTLGSYPSHLDESGE